LEAFAKKEGGRTQTTLGTTSKKGRHLQVRTSGSGWETV